ncbi:MAG: DUF5991 domain-containing protein [Pyrinomonadaceae bacterium]
MRKILLIVIGLLALSVHANAQNDWKGTYSFDENGGKNAGGTTIFISHELTVFDGDDGLAARLQSNGYQTSTDLICSAKVEGTKLLIYFQSYGEDNMFEPYGLGDLLLTLERKMEKAKSIVLTHWGKFTPAIPKNAKSGKVYFEATPKK